MGDSYRKSKGNAGLHGVQFQVSLSTVFLLNALHNGIKGWKLSTENEEAGKFDDIILELPDSGSILVQAKHKDNKKITREQLLSDNSKSSDFSLPKYFLSYQEIKSKFNVKDIIICTNADVDKKKLSDIINIQSACSNHILHCGGEGCTFIKFNDSILDCLRIKTKSYHDKNFRGKGVDGKVITNENLRDFLGKLQFFTGYPSDDKLNEVIEHLLSHLTESKLWSGISSQEIYGKVEQWFKKDSGEYLTEQHAKAIACEIRSDQYCKALKDYKISFQSNDLSFTDEKRMFHVEVEEGHLLQVLKIYHALPETKTLYVDFSDGIEKQMLDTFKIPKYVFIILICSKIRNHSAITSLKEDMKEILDIYKYKKIIFVGKKRFIQELRLDYEVVSADISVTFDDLTQDTRKKLVAKRNISFQGEDVSLEEFFDKSTTKDLGKAINSEILEKLVKDEKVKVGIQPQGLCEDTARYYIDRTIERETYEIGDSAMNYKKKKDTLNENNVFDFKEKVMLISDSAGMGKSTVLTKLAGDVKEKNPHLWVIRIELNNYTRILRDSTRKRKKSITITEMLDSNDATKFSNHLEKFIFSMDGKVVIMLDGFDEISPDYTELILNLLSQCQKATNFAKVIITSRPNMNETLEKTLQVKPFVLGPFTERNQVDFLTRYWIHNLELDDEWKERCKRYSVSLINKISFWINEENNFGAVPLQVRMLAEIFEENTRWKECTDWEGCKEFLDGDESEPNLPERMRLTELYDMFIEKKLEIYIDKVNPSGAAMSHAFDSLFDQYFVNHQSLAIEIILGSSSILDKQNCNLFSGYRYDSNLETAMLKIGIVQKVNGKINFIHRTYAEYFVAKSVLDISELNNQSLSQDVDFQKFFIDEVLCNPEFSVIRAFLETVLEDVVDLLPPDIFKSYELSSSGTPDSLNRSTLIHLLAREGCVAILRLILKCIQFEIIRGKEIYITQVEDECGNTLRLLKRLVELGGVNIKIKNGDTPLHLASQRGRLEMIKFLIEQGGDVYDKNKGNMTVLHPAAQYGHLDVIKFLMASGLDANVKEDNGFSSLHLAALRGHLDVVEFLMDGDVNFNDVNRDGCTPLLLASWKNHLDVVRCLVDHGVDINIADTRNFTALHAAAQHGHLDIFKFLVACGVDIHSSDDGGFSALHIAAQENQLHIIEFLIERDVRIDLRTVKGSTALHIASMNGRLDVVKLLVKCNIDVNAQHNSGNTALHLAAYGNRLDIVRFLMEKGANTQLETNEGYNVLHSAACAKHWDIVKYLVETGTDINAGTNPNCTPMHCATSSGQLDIVKMLVDHGVVVNVACSNGYTPLHIAAQKGHLDVVKFLVGHGADVSVVNKDNFNSLHIAAYEGHSDVVEFLIQSGVNINAVNSDGCTSGHMASWKGHLSTLQCLVEHGVDVDMGDIRGITSLHAAALYGHLDVTRYLVESGASVNATDTNGSTPLQRAAEENHLEVIKFLVERDANVNAKNCKGFTALHLAAEEGHSDVVRYFLEHGVDVNITNNDDLTALHLADQHGHSDIVRVLKGGKGLDDDDFTRLQLASRDGDLEMVRTLVERGADVNAVRKGSCPLLYLASWKGHLDLVKYFVEQGADIDTRDDNDFTALQAAVQHGHMDIVRFFTSHGADIHRGNNHGFIALHVAAQENHLRIVEHLLEKGGHIDTRTKIGSTPLHIAAQNGHLDVVKFLVNEGENVDAKNDQGFTPLHLAARKGKLDIIQFLLNRGVDINVKSSGNLTALHTALQEGHLGTVKYLVESGVSVNVQTEGGYLALHMASEQGHLHIVKYFLETGAPVDSKNRSGATPLHFAAWGGCLNIIRLLVEKGGNVNAKDDAGFTPLHLASQKGHLDIVKYLLSCGAHINSLNRNGYTVLHLAIQEGHLGIVRHLVEAGTGDNKDLLIAAQHGQLDVLKFLEECGADINNRDDEGVTTFHLAAQGNRLEIMEHLFERGVDVNIRTDSGNTPLHVAAFKGHVEAVEFLLKHGVDIQVVDDRAFTALHVAAGKGHLDVVKCLVEFGARLNAQTEDGHTAFHLAVAEGHLEVAKFIKDVDK